MSSYSHPASPVRHMGIRVRPGPAEEQGHDQGLEYGEDPPSLANRQYWADPPLRMHALVGKIRRRILNWSRSGGREEGGVNWLAASVCEVEGGDMASNGALQARPSSMEVRFMEVELWWHTSVATPTLESPPDSGEQGNGCGFLFPHNNAVNEADKDETSGDSTTSPNTDSDQSAEHNLPDSPFASPTKSKSGAFARDPFAPTEAEISAAASTTGCNAAFNGARNGGGTTNHLLPPALDIPSPKPYFFPMSRLSSDHGAIGM